MKSNFTVTFHPNKQSFTWQAWNKQRRKNKEKQTHIDYVLCSPRFMSFIETVDHVDHPFSTTDHKIVEVAWCYSQFVRGPGNFRCPSDLIKSSEYAELIGNTIRETIIIHIIVVNVVFSLFLNNFSCIFVTCFFKKIFERYIAGS